MRYLCCMIFNLGVIAALPLDPLLDGQWEKFKIDFNKYYSPYEDAIRKNIWSEHKIDIDAHNVEADMEWTSYHMKLNHFTDMTVQEIQGRTHSGISVELDTTTKLYKPQGGNLPASLDWRERGVISAVVDQITCGSDWAIAITGAIEAQVAKKTGILTTLSYQDIVDCSTVNSGCMGGWPDTEFYDLLKTNRGLVKDTCNTYKAKKDICQHNNSCQVTNLRSYAIVSPGDESALQDAVANVGPVAASIGLGVGFLSYKDGVYDNPSCSDKSQRSVLIVGYGTENGVDYWLVKNSFGGNWGDNGYIKMVRNKNNQCGIASRASIPFV